MTAPGRRYNSTEDIYTMLTRLIAIVVALGATTSAVNAQPAMRGMAACRTDAATFCVGIEPGGGRRIACLTANKEKLSAACSAALQQRTAQAPAGAPQGVATPAAPGAGVAPPAVPAPAVPGAGASPAPMTKDAVTKDAVTKDAAPPAGKVRGGRLAACRADMQQLCAAVPAGGGSKVRCLRDNQAKLSPACAQTMADLKTANQVVRGACITDAKTLCPGLKGDQRLACFAENQAKLSPECSAMLGKRAAR